MKNIYLLALVACGLSLQPVIAQNIDKDPALRNIPASIAEKIKAQRVQKQLPAMPAPKAIEQKSRIGSPSHASQLRAATTEMRLDSAITVYADNAFLATKVVYSYNEAGETIKTTTYTDEQGIWAESGYAEYTYNDAGDYLSERRYSSTGELVSEWLCSYYASGVLKEDVRNGYSGGKINQKTIYTYNESGQRTCDEYYLTNSDGELYIYDKYVYDYDEAGRQTLYEAWKNNGSELQLRAEQYTQYDSEGRMIYWEDRIFYDGRPQILINKCAYDSKGRRTLYDYISNTDDLYWHTIETWDYTSDGSAIYEITDSTHYKTDNNDWWISAYSSDCTYNTYGDLLHEMRYAVDWDTGERTVKDTEYLYEYNEQRLITRAEQRMYSGDEIYYLRKDETKYLGDANNYEMLRYEQYANAEDWTCIGGTKYEQQIDEKNYWFIEYNWDVESESWIDNRGYKETYSGYDENYEVRYYNWDYETDDWVLTSGDKYINETYDDGSSLYYVGRIDPNTGNWITNFGTKTEISGTNPEIYEEYTCVGTVDDWELERTVYSYFSEAPLSANESIAAQTTMKVYSGNGTLRIESAQAGTLSVYTAAGRCVYVAPTDGTAQISNLAGGIYIVRLQTATGTETLKVSVK